MKPYLHALWYISMTVFIRNHGQISQTVWKIFYLAAKFLRRFWCHLTLISASDLASTLRLRYPICLQGIKHNVTIPSQTRWKVQACFYIAKITFSYASAGIRSLYQSSPRVITILLYPTRPVKSLINNRTRPIYGTEIILLNSTCLKRWMKKTIFSKHLDGIV